jgi:hypothetical protein
MAENIYTGQNEDPKYRKKVYDILSSNFEDFKLSESDFYKKLDSDTGYAPKVYKVLKDNFADFEKPEKDFMSLVGPSKKKDLFGKITTSVGQLQKEAGEALGGVKKGLETVASAAAQYETKVPRTSGPVEEKVKVEVEEKLDPNDLVGSFKKRLAPLAAPSIPGADATYVRPNMDAIFSEQERKRPEVAKKLEQEKNYKDLKNAFLTDENLSVTQLMKATGLSAEAIKGASREDIMKMARPGNETDKLAAESVAEAQDINAAFSQSRNLEEAAIRLAASKDPQIARQLEITSRKAPAKNLQEIVSGTKDIMADPKTMFGEVTIGRFIYQLATNPIAVQQIEKNPNLKKQFKETLPLLINKYPDFGKSYLGNVISQKMEDMGMNNALLNIVTKEETDKVVEQLSNEGKMSPAEVQFYKDNMREGGIRNFAKTIVGEQLYKTPGLLERTAESAVAGVKALGSGAGELTGIRQGLVGERDMVATDIAVKDAAVNIRPSTTINEMTAYGGDFLGHMLSPGLLGKGLTAAKVFRNPDNAIKALFGLQAFGNYMPQARAMFPGENLKQRAYAGILSGFEIATENIFRDRKVIDGLVGKVKPQVAKVIRQFTDKEISGAAARETVEGAIRGAIKSIPQYTKYFAKGVGENTFEETVTQLGQQLTDGVFTGKKFSDWLNGEELFETARISALGSTFIAGLSARADMIASKGITAKMVYDMAEKPDYWIAKIKEGATLDPDLAADADDKIANLEYASKVRQDLESTNLSEKQKIKYLINALEANVKSKSSQGITDPVLKKKAEQQAKEVEKQQEAILNGDDQGEIEGDLSDEVVEPAGEVPQQTLFEQISKRIEEIDAEEKGAAGEVAPEVPQTVEQLRAAEQAEYAAMADPNDEVKRQEIYDRYDKLITPLLEKEKEVSEAAPVPSIIEVKSPKEVKQGDTIVWRGEDFIVEEVNPKGGFNLRNAADRTNTVKDARITDEEFQGKRGEVAAVPKVEKFGVGFAPFREKNVFTEEEDVDIRTSPDYQLHQENVQKVAQGLGIKINNKLDTWGGYVDSETGNPVQEVSNIMEIEATPEQARVMAAILGKAAPEMQDSVLLGNYNENGAGFEHIVKTGSFANAKEAIKLLKDNELQYFSVDKNSGDVIILDLEATDTPKIINLVKQLNENGIPAKHKYGKVNAEFIGSGDYDGIIEAERSRVGAETGFDIDAFVQEAAGKYDAIKAARTQPVVTEVQKSIADKIRGLKIDLSKLGDGGAQSNIAGLPVALYNTVVEAVALAVEAGVAVNKAINDAVKQYKLDKAKDFDKDVLAREILKGIEITEPQVNPVYFENLKKFASESSFDNKIQFKNSIQSLFAKYLPELKAKFGKDFDPSNYDERARKYLVDLVTRESLNAIKKHPEAIGWYDEKTQSALDVISAIHPEIAIDAEARGAFILPLAIMSNGNKVDFNFELAEKQYQFFKDNGRFNPDGEFGLQQSGIKKSLMLINSLLDNGLTMSGINKFLTSKYRAGDLKIKIDGKVKDLASGELADEQVYGAVILGPKIGNGFYMNLWGQFDQLTMDRWFMRTWGRMTGTLIEKDAAGIAEGKKRLSKALDEIKKDSEALAILKSLLPKISSLSIQDLAKSIEKVSMDKKKRAELSSNPKTDELRKAANSLSKNLSGEKEAPSTGKERRFIREVFTDVVNDLKNKYGIEISMADLQAALWYPEKILYESFKGGETFEAAAEGYTSDSAPDYLNAAKKLATKLGVNEEQINQTLSRGRERAERIAGEGYPEGGRAISESYQDILGRVKEAIGEKPATEKVRAAAKTVRSLKIKQEGLQANIAGIPIALYNAALETIATALEAGASLTDAIREAIRKHKLNKQKDFDSDTFVKQLESVTGQTVEKIGGKYAIQIEAAGEVPVQPKAGVSEEVEGGVPGAKPKAAPEEGKAEGEEEKVRVSGIKKGLVSQEILSRVNLNTVGDKELLESGRAIIESGEVKPKTVVNRVIDGGQGVLTPAEVVAMITYKADLDTKQEDLSKEIERRTKAGEDLGDLLVEYKDLQVEIDNYDIAAVITAQQQSLAFRLRRYLLDREYNITVQINRYKQTNGGTIPESVLAKFKKLNETIKDLREKIKDAEAVKYEEDSKAAMQNIIEDVERENKANGPKLYTEQELEDKIREGVQKEIDGIYSKMPAEKKSKAQRVVDALDNIQRKLRSKTYDASLGVPVAFIDAGITAIKNAIKLGIEVEKAIEIGIKTIKDKLNGAKWDKEADFRKDMMEGFKEEGVDVKKTKEVKARINDDGTITIPNKDIRDFVSQGIEDIDDLADAILNKYQAELPGVSSRQVRDAITKYGKEVSQTRDDISIKLGRAKRVGRLLSELEDLRTMDKGAFLLKYQRVKPAQDKISEREKNLKYLIRQLGREIMGDESLPDNYDEQKALDTAKNRISRRIEELRDKIKRGDFSKKQKRRVQADQELVDLQSQLEKTKSEFDLEHEKNEQKNKKWYQKAGDFVLELFSGIPRTLVTGFDFGIVFTQGIRKVFTNPVMSAKAFVEAGKQFFSESRQKKMENELKVSGAYALIKNSGLSITEGVEKASAQEQIFIVNYVNLIWDAFARVITLNYKPGTELVKAMNPFKASQRFFDGYLNYIRINSFLNLSNAIDKNGYTPETHPEIYKAAAEFVNTTTGKGAKNIPKSLGFLMFSASKVASELKLYTPYAFYYYAKMPKAVRNRAMLEFGTFALSFSTAMLLLRAALDQGQGDDEDDEFWDINSSNFLTFKFGNQRVSFAAGARPTLVFMGRLFSGVYVDQYGQESKLGERTGKQINTKFDLIVRFFTAKAAPVPAAAIQYLDKKAGVEVEDDVFKNLVLPMWLQDSQELYAQNPKEIGALYTLLSLIGANIRTVEGYTEREYKMPQKISYTDDYSRKREAVLTDEQKADFQKMFDEKFKKNIEDIKNSESYKNLTSENDKIFFDVTFGKKAKDDAESDAKKELIRKYRGPFSEFPIIRETPEEKEINRILNRGEKKP